MGNCMSNFRHGGDPNADGIHVDASASNTLSSGSEALQAVGVSVAADESGRAHHQVGEQPMVTEQAPLSVAEGGILSPPVDAIQQWGHDVVWLFSNEQDKNAEAFDERPYKFNNDVGNLYVGFTCRKGMKPNAPSSCNQDDLFIAASLSGPNRFVEWALLGVVDGHGPYGHDVARKVAHSIPQHCLLSPQLLKPLPEADVALQESFQLAQLDLNGEEFVEKAHMSGTAATAVFVLPILASTADTTTGESKQKKRVFCANVGNVTAYLGGMNGQLQQLTVTHLPNQAEEKARIQSSGGTVKRLTGAPRYRVFAKDDLQPGIDTSRSVGDHLATSLGVVADPHVFCKDVDVGDDVLLICSDGVWDKVSPQEALAYVMQQSPDKVQQAAHNIASVAFDRWRKDGNFADDITVLALWLNTDQCRVGAGLN